MGKSFNYGGQAVIEGVMMRGSQAMAVAVRDPQGRIVLHSEPLSPAVYQGPLGRLPLLRGLSILWDALALGYRSLMFSANVAIEAEAGQAQPGAKPEPAFAGPLAWGTLAVALVFGVGVFFLLPKLAAAFFESIVASTLAGLVFEGVLRLALFVGYVWLIGYMPDIRRVFAYHGAEHKTINAYEAGAPLTVEGVRPFGTAHTRCGTALLLTLVVLSILVFAPLAHLPLGWALLARVLLIPVLAMLAYELIRFSARHMGWAWVRLIVAPNLALQRLTTREPDDAMLEVSIAALQRVLESEQLAAQPAGQSISAACSPQAAIRAIIVTQRRRLWRLKPNGYLQQTGTRRASSTRAA